MHILHHIISYITAGLLLAALPVSTNYEVHNLTFGSGGTANSSSTNFGLNATLGEVSGQTANSTNYTFKSGHNETQQAYVPSAPTFTNPGGTSYNRLSFIINNGNNPSDTKFVLAISSDNFVTTFYVQADDTVGVSQVYQTYTAWGGGSGQTINGLAANTTYKLKVKAMQGNFTETQYGPTATAATVNPTISFDIDVSATDSSTSPPYILNFGALSQPGTITDSPMYIWVSLDTNADFGGAVYVSSANTGLTSTSKSYTIASQSVDLSTVPEGTGAKVNSVTQTSGGPLTSISPYNGSGSNVGIADGTIRKVFNSSASIVGGRGSVVLKAKPKQTTPPATDYNDVLTLIASAAF